MLKRTKMVISLSMASLLAMGTLAGCASKQEVPSSSAQGEVKKEDVPKKEDAKKEEASKPEKNEITTVEWLGYNCYGQPDNNAEIIKTIEEKYGIKFNFWFVDDQKWDEVLGVKLSSGEMPDVMRVKNTTNVPKYVKQGILGEITDETLSKLPTFQKAFNEYDTNGLGNTDVIVDGKLYVLKGPNPSGSYPTVLTWRKDWLKAVGIDKIPETLQEFEDAMYKFTKNDPDGNGKNDTYGLSNTSLNAVFGAYGAVPLKEFRGKGTQNLFYTEKDGKIVFAATQPEMKEALALLQKWYADGLIDPEFITGENKAGYWASSQDFENGKVGVTGMSMATHWQPPVKEGVQGGACYESYIALNPQTVWGETIDIGKAPVGPEGKAGTHTWGAIGTAGFGFTTSATSDSVKMDKICALLEETMSDFNQYEMLTKGIEGTHYNKDEDGNYAFKEGFTTNAELSKAGITVLAPLGNPDFVKQMGPKGFEFADQYKGPGYTDILVPPTDGQTKYLTDLKTFALDSYVKIITGEESIDYFDTFVEEFNKRGGTQIEQEISEAVN